MDRDSKGGTPDPLTLSELAELVRSRVDDLRICDLRDPIAFERGHIPQSSRLGIDEIDLPYVRPPRRRRLVLVADDPLLATKGAFRLREIGYDANALGAPVSCWAGEWESGPERAPAWEPSRLVMEWGSRFHGLRDAVDLGCGSGRDAVHLALLGLRVTAIDVLPDALEQGRRLANRHRTEVSFLRADLERDTRCWVGPWDLINVQRFLHRRSLPLLGDRLRANGYLLYETFIETQAERGRKPRNRTFLLRRGELRETLGPDLQILDYREGQNDDEDWTASLVARKAARVNEDSPASGRSRE